MSSSPISTAGAQPPAAASPPAPQPQAAEVVLISNPIPSFSVFQWVPRGVGNLNRRNKLSSLPFWFPNNTSRRHQFRLVMLRGVVKEEHECDDSVAVFLEYIPPPPPSGGGGEENTNGSNVNAKTLHPKGCKITARLLNRNHLDSGDRSFDIVEEDTATIDAEERQMGFREFISSRVISNPAFVGESDSVILEVSILVGVNVVAENVAKSTGQFAESLWSSLSTFTTQVTTLVKKTVQAVQEQREEYGEPQPGSEQTTESSNTSRANNKRELPWDAVPERWAGGREESWRHFVTLRLIDDDNTFLIGAKRGIATEEQLLMTQYGLNYRAILAADSLFDFERDVHEGLLSLQTIRARRYRLVPQKVSDEAFWGNFMWKVAALSTCSSDEQATLLLSILNSPRLVEGDGSNGGNGCNNTAASGSSSAAASANAVANTVSSLFHFATGSLSSFVAGSTKPLSNEEVAGAVKEALEAASTLQDLLQEGDDVEMDECFAGAAISSCESNLAVVEKLLRRSGEPELHESLQQTAETLRRQLETFNQRAAEKQKEEHVAKENINNGDANECVDAPEVTEDCVSRSPAASSPPQVPRQETGEDLDADEQLHQPSRSPPVRAVEPLENKSGEDAEKSMPASAPRGGFSFERVPSIDDMDTPAVRLPGAAASSSSLGGSTSAARRGGSVANEGSNKKLEFAPMPWEEDDE